MASALTAGFLKAGLAAPEEIVASDPDQVRRELFARRFAAAVTADNLEAVRTGEVVICAVKPGSVDGVLREIAPAISGGQLFISVAGGIELDYLEARLPDGVPVVRAMPNVAAVVGESMTALALGKAVQERECVRAEEVFQAVGRTVVVPESCLDAVTGLSGCGPAYVAILVEALADGGVKMGLPRETALELAVQTVLGTARLLQETGEHPGQLKDRVTSPGGSTICGLHVLENGGLRGLIISAVEAATKKSGDWQS